MKQLGIIESHRALEAADATKRRLEDELNKATAKQRLAQRAHDEAEFSDPMLCDVLDKGLQLNIRSRLELIYFLALNIEGNGQVSNNILRGLSEGLRKQIVDAIEENSAACAVRVSE